MIQASAVVSSRMCRCRYEFAPGVRCAKQSISRLIPSRTRRIVARTPAATSSRPKSCANKSGAILALARHCQWGPTGYAMDGRRSTMLRPCGFFNCSRHKVLNKASCSPQADHVKRSGQSFGRGVRPRWRAWAENQRPGHGRVAFDIVLGRLCMQKGCAFS